MILLDTERGNEGNSFGGAIYCVLKRSTVVIWWFRLWGVGGMGSRPAKEKKFSLSILCQVKRGFDVLKGCVYE